PRVVGGDASLESAEPRVVAEDGEVVAAHGAGLLLDVVSNGVALRRGRESDSGAQHLLHRRVASLSAEDEADGGQQVVVVEEFADAAAIEPLLAIAPTAGVDAPDVFRLSPRERPPPVPRGLDECRVDAAGAVGATRLPRCGVEEV